MRRLIFFLLGTGSCLVGRAQEAAAGAEVLAASTSFSGYISTGYHLGSSTGSYNYSFAYPENNGFTLDHIGLSFARPLEDYLLDSGFRFDVWVGPQASELGTSDSSDGSVSIRRAYIDLRLPWINPLDWDLSEVGSSIDLRMGTFDSLLGYESPDPVENPHYTHSWGYTIQPTLHTGILAVFPGFGRPGVDPLFEWDSTYQFSLGLVNSIEPRISGFPDNKDRKSLLTGFTWELPSYFGPVGGSRLSLGYLNGRDLSEADPVQNIFGSLGLALPSDKWSLALTYDSRMLHGPGNDDTVLGAHLGYQANKKLQLHLRGEHFQDGSSLFSGESSDEQSDGQGVTVTAEYQLWENVLSRLEYRWDHTEQRVNDRHNTQAWHLNLIYKF
jgi:hypothetical protein